MSFLTVCLNPTFQKTLLFSGMVQGEVNRTAEHRFDVSGKGINVTRVLNQLGKKAVHLTQLGEKLRPLFLELCDQEGLSVEWAESKSLIRFCYTIINEGTVTELVEESCPVDPGTEDGILEKYNFLINKNISCLIISGTKAQGFSDKTFPYMTEKAKEKGLKIILDIKGNDLKECLKLSPDIIKPNLHEFIETFGINKTMPEVYLSGIIKEAMLDIAEKYKTNIILTDGNKKIRILETNSGKDINYYEKFIVPVIAVNTTGSGDAFTAGFASALLDGDDFQSCINEGIKCGALNAGLIKPGVITSAV